MATIRVPGPPPEAFRKNRPISDLIKSQISHLQHLEHKLQIVLPTKFLPHDLTTEATAARYIAEMTAALRSRSAAAQQRTIPVRVIPALRPDSTPASRSVPPPALKTTRQSNGIAVTSTKASKKPGKKKQASTKHAKKKS